MAFAAARMILKDKRRKSKEDFTPPQRTRSKVFKSRNFGKYNNVEDPLFTLY